MREEFLVSRGSNGSDFLIGLLTGAVLGVTIGLMFAPKSGAETRRQIGDSSERFRRNAARSYRHTADNVASFLARRRESGWRGREAAPRPGVMPSDEISIPNQFPEGPLPTA